MAQMQCLHCSCHSCDTTARAAIFSAAERLTKTATTTTSALPTSSSLKALRNHFNSFLLYHLFIALTLYCLLPTARCDSASVPAQMPSQVSALSPLDAIKFASHQTQILPRRRFKRMPYTTPVDGAETNSATPPIGDGNVANVSGRLPLWPSSSFGYDGAKIKPQKFYAHNRLLTTPSALHVPVATQGNNDLTVWNLLDDSKRVDICEVCNCGSVKNSFVTISCDYNQRDERLSEIFGANYRVPTAATSITIKLAATTHFRLERDFFVNNSLMNSFTIDGAHSDGEQVEITTGAFPGDVGTIGPYPDILMRNVFSVVVREAAFSGNKKFTVRKSNDLILYSNAFENAEINGRFVGVADLRIEERAFNSAKATLHIENSHIDNIYRFEASLREIRFINCTIGTINSGTFDVNNIYSIAFENSRIDVIKARAITEKLFSNHVSIIGGIIGSIEGEAIYGSGINELILRKNRIDTIHANAIHVSAINATIADNHIKHLGQNWLRVKEWSNIVIEKNRFGDFGAIELEDTKKPGNCRFDGNSLTRPLPGSLNITNPYCILREISVDLPCRCNLEWLYELSAHDLRSETYCTIDAKLGACFNATTFNTLKYVHEVCDDSKTTLDCVANRNLKKVDGKFFTPEELERENSKLVYVILYLSVAIILAVALVTVLVLSVRCLCRRKRGSSGASLGSHQTAGRHHRHEFSSNERHIIERTLQLIQKKHPDIHARAERLCQELLQTSLTEKKCIKTVTKLENLLNEMNRCEDLIAFYSVLAQHLQPQLPTAPPTLEAVYSTGSFEQVPRETYDGPLYAVGCIDASHTVVSMEAARLERERERERERDRERASSVEGEGVNEAHNVPNEPFYEELGQPLLRNDYALPADGREYASPHDHATDVNGDLEYAEPVNNRADYSQRLPPYAPPKNAQPSSSKLPTQPSMPSTAAMRNHSTPQPPHSLYQSSPTATSSRSRGTDSRPPLPPLTNVQRIAHGLQNLPNFQLPNATQRPRNLHLVSAPVYTAPDIRHKRLVTPLPTPATSTARLATPEVDESDSDMRGAMALSPDTGSDHSGGSNETVKIDDVIQYADA